MGRPAEVSDEDIIAAGKDLAQRGAVTATGLWLSCGRHGRPARLITVWQAYAAQTAADQGQALSEALLIPDEARTEGTRLKVSLSQGIDQAIGCIYQVVERACTARYQQEVDALQTARGATVNEVAEALAALGDASEECAGLRATIERQKDENRTMKISLSALREDLSAARRQISKQTNTYMELKLACLKNESLFETAKGEVARAHADRCAAEDRALQARESLLISRRDTESQLAEITRLTSERDQAAGKIEAFMARAIRAEQALERGGPSLVDPAPASDATVAPRRSPRIRFQQSAGHEAPDKPSAMAPALHHLPVEDAHSAGESVRP